MSSPYYWKTPEDAAFIMLLLGFLGIIQIFLSYAATTYPLYIASPVVLTLVPLGVVLAQTAGAAILASTLLPLIISIGRQPKSRSARPIRQYFLRFAIFLLAASIILGIWGLVYALWFLTTPFNQPAYLVKYILANTSGAIIPLIFSFIMNWLFKR